MRTAAKTSANMGDGITVISSSRTTQHHDHRTRQLTMDPAQRTAQQPQLLPLLLMLLLTVANIDGGLCQPTSRGRYDATPATSPPDAASAEAAHSTWRLITRSEWGARTPNCSMSNFTGAAPFAIVHHSSSPNVCRTMAECKAAMRSFQTYHMEGRHWCDIGYSFAVGGDGNVYEARGYNVVGAHTPNYNGRSIGLLLIGRFIDNPPPTRMLEVAQDFLQYSMRMGHLRDDYTLYGHRQVRATECPGNALYKELQKWDHWRA